MSIEMTNYLFQDREMIGYAAACLCVALTTSRVISSVVDNIIHHMFVRKQYDYEREHPL